MPLHWYANARGSEVVFSSLVCVKDTIYSGARGGHKVNTDVSRASSEMLTVEYQNSAWKTSFYIEEEMQVGRYHWQVGGEHR